MLTTMGELTGIKWKFKVCKPPYFEMLIESLGKVQKCTRLQKHD